MDELREVAQALELQPDATIDEILAVIAALKEAAGVTDNKTVGQSKPHSASVLSRADVLREWHASPELRSEFGGDFDTFTAWRTNAAAGNCSVVGRSAAS